jgi:hypothetical protein
MQGTWFSVSCHGVDVPLVKLDVAFSETSRTCEYDVKAELSALRFEDWLQNVAMVRVTHMHSIFLPAVIVVVTVVLKAVRMESRRRGDFCVLHVDDAIFSDFEPKKITRSRACPCKAGSARVPSFE